VDTKEKANSLSNQIIGAAIEVHKTLGPGLLESAYQACHKYELELRNIPVQTEVSLPSNTKASNSIVAIEWMKWLAGWSWWR
jgi:GxxExxY protein